MAVVSSTDGTYGHPIDGRVHLGTTPAASQLIGRAKECRVLDALLDTVRGGESGVLVVRGEAGIGKSALLQHLVQSASGFQVVRVTAVESEMELPFAALHQLCAPIAAHVPALPEPQRNTIRAAFGEITAAPPDRLLIGLAVLSLFAAASESHPVLCVVDDAHWLDRASSQALAFVARRLQAEPVVLVFACRATGPDLADLPEMVVEGLRDGDAQTVLSTVLRVPLDARVRDRIVAETMGNPLALVEWPRGLTSVELAGGFGLPGQLPMTTQIEEVFRRRIASLPPATQRFLAIMAAEPTGDAPTVWRAGIRLDVGPDDAGLAIDAGLVEIGVRARFRHPLIRSASYSVATLALRQEAHRALAAETDPEDDPDRRAWHRALGSPGPDEDIADELVRSAGRARARGGLAAAGVLLERSVALSVDPDRRAERILAAAAATLEAGSFAATSALLAAADRVPLSDLDRARLDLLRARHAAYQGDLRDGPRLLLGVARTLENLDIEMAETTYLQAMATACTAGEFSHQVTLRDIAEAALARPQSGEPTTNQWLLTGFAQLTALGADAATIALRRSLSGTATETFAAGQSHLLGFQCGVASVLWDGDALHRIAELKVAATREVGALTMLPSSLNTLAHSFALSGDLSAAATLVAEANEIVDAIGSTFVTWAGSHLAGLRGDPDGLASMENAAARASATGHALALANARWAMATWHNARGEYERAFAVAHEASRTPWEWGQHVYFAELVEAAVRTQEVAVAEAMVAKLEETTVPSGSDWGLGLLARSRALLAGSSDAEALYCEAIDRLSSTRIRPELARAHLVYGEWLRRENRRVDARAQLRVAHSLLTEMGVAGFAERARRELLATGESVRSRREPSAEELTPQEDHIARLAADGLTNPEIGERLFISSRTVEWHLRKIFLKLGISSRRELRTSETSSQQRPTRVWNPGREPGSLRRDQG